MNQTDASSIRKNLFGNGIPFDQKYCKNPMPFGQNHINNVDNTRIEKLPRVEYEIDFGDYSKDEEGDQVSNVFEDAAYTYENRPMKTIDAIFERKMGRRLTLFHSRPIDRTQFDKELLAKQLELETIKVIVREADESVR